MGKLNEEKKMEIGVDDLVLMLVLLDDGLVKIFKIRNTSFQKLK